MSAEAWTAVSGVLIALFSVFGVKALDAVTNGRTKRLDELAQVRDSQGKRIEALETKLEAKDREFDAYRDETNERMNEMRDKLRELQAENRELRGRLAQYERGSTS